MSTSRRKKPSKRTKIGSVSRVSRKDVADIKPIRLEIDGEDVEFPDYPAIAKRYAEGVVAKKWKECRYVVLACKRYLDMLEKAKRKGNAYFFSDDHAIDVCQFFENLRHVEGTWDSDTVVLEPWQCFMLCGIFGFRRQDGTRLVRRVYIEIPRKHGKALSLDTAIPTPAGFKRMGDLREGDEVFAADGSVTKVSHIFPVEIGRPCYEVEFSTGEVIVADEEHEWLTKARRFGPRAGRHGKKADAGASRVFTTGEIRETLRYGVRGDFNHRVDVAGALDLPEAEFDIAPYVLGAWLGDGNSSSAQITAPEKEIRDIIAASGETLAESNQAHSPHLYLIGSGGRTQAARNASLQARLRRLGVLGNKHIPQAYLRGSIEQRWALLRGLMDTDGTVNKSRGLSASMCEFTTTSPALRDGVRELVASLGMKPSESVGTARLNGRDCGPKWSIRFKAFADQPVFGLERKQSLLAPRPAKPTRSSGRTIVDVRPVDSVPVRCIEVDHPDHLYLAGEGFIPTHNSLFAAGIVLYCTACEGEKRPLGYIAAATEDQAKKVLAPAKELIDTDNELRTQFGFRTLKKQIDCAETRGEIITISSVGEHQDGHNPHVVILEELHAQKPDVYDVMDSAFGARRNPLMYQIGTAGRYAAGLGYTQRQAAIRVLDGTVKADEVFPLIYTIDAEDIERCYDTDVIIKANPNWNVSIFEDVILDRVRQAKDDPTKRGEFLRTRLNVWSNAGFRLIEPEAWEACEAKKLRMIDMKGRRAWLAVDLAKYLDMAALGMLIEMPGGKLAGFANFYIPEDSTYMRRADLWPMYSAWIDDGYITTTPGGVMNPTYIRDDVIKLCSFLDVQGVAADPWQAQQLAAELVAGGIEVQQYRNTPSAMSDPTYEMLARINSGEFVHQGNPVLTWNAMNVEGEERNDTIFPRKPAQNSDEKIDGFVSLVMANGVRLNMKAEDTAKENPYETKSFMRDEYERSGKDRG